MSSEGSLLDLQSLRQAEVARQPYAHVVASGVIRDEAAATLSSEFPDIRVPGFHLVRELQLAPSFQRLVAELEGPGLAEVLSDKLDVDLRAYPVRTAIRRFSQLTDGSIHTDARSKIATFLLYMNEAWADDGGGRLRVLRGPNDIDDMAAEISPVMGSTFSFRRTDNSWHGHRPFEGERRVVQVTWQQREADRGGPVASFLRRAFKQ